MISLPNVLKHSLYVALALFVDEGGRCRKSERVLVARRNTTLFTGSMEGRNEEETETEVALVT
jgi:hypothetical protein